MFGGTGGFFTQVVQMRRGAALLRPYGLTLLDGESGSGHKRLTTNVTIPIVRAEC